MSVIANTTVISNFAGIEQLDILRQLHGTVYLSIEVYQEIQTGLEEGYLFYQTIDEHIYPLQNTGWLKLTSMSDESEFLLFSELPSRLHPGEASVGCVPRTILNSARFAILGEPDRRLRMVRGTHPTLATLPSFIPP